MKLQDKIKKSISSHYSNKQEVLDFQSMVKNLNDGKWVNKDVMLQTMISYMTFNEQSINELAKISLLHEVNYNSLKDQYDSLREYYKAVSKASNEVNELLTEIGVKE